jgi:hypothetical protein
LTEVALQVSSILAPFAASASGVGITGALRECNSSDIYTAGCTVLGALIPSDLIELLSPDTAAMSALPL